MLPAGRVKRTPGKTLDPRQRRRSGFAERANGRDEHVGCEGSGVRVELPVLPGGVPARFENAVLEVDVRAYAEPVRAVLQVTSDLGLR